MRAVAFAQHGGPEVLQLVDDWPEPEPTLDEVVVKVDACALNHLDLFVRRGMPDVPIRLPRVPGGDIAGTVIALGRDVADVQVGQRVLVDPAITLPDGRSGALGENTDGGLTERIAVPAANLIPLPAGVGATAAAALPIAYGTAHRMLVARGQVKPGETVVVLGASGGVGTASVQLAAMIGAEVIAVSGSRDKLARLAGIGARHLVLASGQEYGAKVWKITGKRGADVIVDYTGQETWPATVRTVRHGGRILVCGATSGYRAVTDLRYVWVREATIIGSDGWRRADLETLVELVAAGRLRPVIDRVIGLDQVRRAEEDLEARRVFGKIVVDPHG
jgi:alcohol dehydrogenase